MLRRVGHLPCRRPSSLQTRTTTPLVLLLQPPGPSLLGPCPPTLTSLDLGPEVLGSVDKARVCCRQWSPSARTGSVSGTCDTRTVGDRTPRRDYSAGVQHPPPWFICVGTRRGRRERNSARPSPGTVAAGVCFLEALSQLLLGLDGSPSAGPHTPLCLGWKPLSHHMGGTLGGTPTQSLPYLAVADSSDPARTYGSSVPYLVSVW